MLEYFVIAVMGFECCWEYWLLIEAVDVLIDCE